MSTLAMARPLGKTYGRTTQKVDTASKAFDEVVLGATGRPCSMKATSIIQKWGKASFTSTRGSPAADSPQKSRKRKIEDDNSSPQDDDPFSFDLEDVGPSKTKKGMGYKVSGKTKAAVVNEPEKAKNTAAGKKVLRASGKNAVDRSSSKVKLRSDDDNETENETKCSPLHEIHSTETDKKTTDSVLLKKDGSPEKQKPNQKKQLLMDRFTNKTTRLEDDTNSTNLCDSKHAKSEYTEVKILRPRAAKKFFVSRELKSENKTENSPGKTLIGARTESGELPQSESEKNNDRCYDVWNDIDAGHDLDSGDPEIIFNTSKKSESSRENSFLQSPCFNEDSSPPCLSKPAVSDVSENSSNGVKKPDRKASTLALRSTSSTKATATTTTTSNVKAKSDNIPVVKRLLTNSRKGAMTKKASYNHRQWHNPDDKQSSPDSDSGLDAAPEQPQQQKTAKDEMAFDGSDEELVKSPTPLYKTSGKPKPLSHYRRDDVSVDVKVTVAKKHKPLFMVVRNVKRAHECQEYGETQEFTDDIDYIMDGLHSGQPLSTRCLSAINLVNKCASHAFRMHLRAHGILAKILSALHDAAKFPTLALSTAAVMYMMAKDRLTLELDELNLELVLQVLSSEAPGADMDLHLLREYETTQKKIYSVFDGFHQNGKVQRTDMLLTDVTAGHLAMEALLRLTSRRDGDWFKTELRTLGGLDRIVDTVCKAIDSVDEAMLELTDSAIDVLTKVDRCFRVLENVTYLKPENQNHLIVYNSSTLINSLSSCLRLCETCLPFNELATKGDKVNKESPGYVVFSCLLATIRVLVNLTHDNEIGSAKIGQEDGLIKTVLTCVLRLPRYLPTAERFDILVLGLGLLVNLIEHSRNNLRILLNAPAVAPFDQYPSISGTLNSLEALGMLFSLRFEAAKMIEEEHDAELEERERQRQELATRCAVGIQSGGNESGMWQESDSGIQWIAVAKDSRARDSASGMSDNASSVGDFQLLSQTSSQGEAENFTKALHKAGRHMEDSIVAAYIALVVGCVIQHNVDLAEKVRDTLPDCSFDPMIRMLRKFLGFMNLTSASAANNSKSILRVLEVLESC